MQLAGIRPKIISVLADGRFHSGTAIAERFGVSRTAVWKHIRHLQSYGLDVFSVRGRGYRLAGALELLDPSAILDAVTDPWFRSHGALEVRFETDSTNQRLMRKLADGDIHAQVLLAEFQSNGRGRRGSAWISPFASGIIMSMGWHFEATPQTVTALSLAAGVAVATVLENHTGLQVFLKWPNDIICKAQKIGGILIESKGETAGPFDVVIGIGMNVSLPDSVIHSISQPVTDITRNLSGSVSRNMLAAALISKLAAMLREFDQHGFSPFIEKWRALDYCRSKQATLVFPDRQLRGTVQGIDENGFLVMEVDGSRRVFSSGDLSLRFRE